MNKIKKNELANSFGDLFQKRISKRAKDQNLDDNAIKVIMMGFSLDDNIFDHMLSQEFTENIKGAAQILHEEAVVLVDEIRSAVEKGGE